VSGDTSDALVYLGHDPLNAETRLDHVDGPITPAGAHYVRDHFAIPAAPGELTVGGAVRTPLVLTHEALRSMPSRALTVTLECAGNGRAFLEPPAPGEQWRLGAVGTAEWRGVPLRLVLEAAGPTAAAAELLFRGADGGAPKDVGRHIAFERSLPLADALRPDVLLAYEMNGAPLPREHGAPLRLVMPRWYGMASVKWLARIELIDRAFDGFYQRDRYVIDGRPLREIAPRAVITDPGDGGHRPPGRLAIRGYAWSGRDPIAGVRVSADGGTRWADASLGAVVSPDAWRPWTIAVDATPGTLVLIARAVTTTGEEQPLSPVRNTLGYGNNAAQPTRVRIG
jgi:DMSO/TMAO reductase YedYZ molybdopterin-dependent catalytic subunit